MYTLDKTVIKRVSYSVKCPTCIKEYKTSRAVRRRMLKSHSLRHSALSFFDENNTVVNFHKPNLLASDSVMSQNYKELLATITERVNAALHPALPGKYV